MRACSFCSTAPADDAATKCRQCGAPLPVAGTGQRLPAGALNRVPPAPRKAPFKVVSAEAGFGLAWGAIFGGVGGGVGCICFVVGVIGLLLPMAIIGAAFTLLFGGIGGAVFAFSYRSANRQLRAYRLGTPVEASLLSVSDDTHVRTGRHPIRLAYTFLWDGEERGGECTTMDARAHRFEEGDAIIVLVDPQAPDHQVLYLR